MQRRRRTKKKRNKPALAGRGAIKLPGIVARAASSGRGGPIETSRLRQSDVFWYLALGPVLSLSGLVWWVYYGPMYTSEFLGMFIQVPVPDSEAGAAQELIYRGRSPPQ
jgi:hypothetical protein